MSNLLDLVNKDLNSHPVAKDPAKAREHAEYGDNELRRRNIEAALMQFNAAKRLDPENREAQRGFHYVRGINLLLRNDGSAALEHLKKVLAIDPKYRSILNAIRTAAVLADDWQVISQIGIQRSSEATPGSLGYLEAPRQYSDFCTLWPYKIQFEEKKYNDHPEVYAYLKEYMGRFISNLPKGMKNCFDGSFFEPPIHLNEMRACIAPVDWKEHREVWLVQCEVDPPIQWVIRPYRTCTRDVETYCYPLKGEHLGMCKEIFLKGRPADLLTLESSCIPEHSSWTGGKLEQVERTFPVLVTVWDVPFYLELHGAFKNEKVGCSSLLQSLTHTVSDVGYTGEAKYRTEKGIAKVLCTPGSPVIDCSPNFLKIRFHQVEAYAYKKDRKWL
ncbi:MAG TPA: tetratricopeptide repeat protein [Candidatus Nanoarchaeia archaeon]|nr:tetratricopeptide repeat protein [Candidatus Nanoarchaeia archaeon]